jgi:hypothetical protein
VKPACRPAARIAVSRSAARRRPRAATGRALATVVLALALRAPLSAASLAGTPSFIPAVYGPGEDVEVTASLAPGASETLSELELRSGAGLPAGSADDPEIRSLRVARTAAGWEMRIRFVPWSPGRGTIPGLAARGAALPSLPYDAVSRLGPEDRDPSPPRPQRLPPGAALALYVLIGAALAVVLAAFGFVAYVIPASRALLARRRAGQAFRRLGKSLDFLTARALSADPAAFSAALARALRLYLAARVEPRAPVLTPGELSALPDDAFPAPSTRDAAAGILAWSDEVRFGGAAAQAAALERAAAEARRIAAENEEALLARA